MLNKLFNIKKRIFKKELKQTTASIWHTEFNMFTTKWEYEKTRQLYSQGQDQLAQVEARLKNEKNEQLEKDKEALEDRLTGLKNTMDDLSIIINGCEPNTKYPEGVRGLQDKLESQVQKREHIKNFIKYNC